MTRFWPKILMISRIYCLKTQFFQKKTSFYIFLLEIRILMERMAILMTFIMLYKKI